MAKRSPNDPELQQLLGRRLVRDFRLSKENAVIDEETRTVRVAITSDEPILHWVRDRGVAWVVLDHKASSINLSRVKARGSRVVDSHDITVRLGFQNNFESDGHVGRVDWRLGPTQRSLDAFAEIKDALDHGDSPGASAGFTIERFANEIEGYKDDFPIIRALKWTLVHGALTADEADIRCGIGRGMNDDECLRATANDDADEDEDPAEEATESDEEEAAEEQEEDAPPAKRKKRKRSITPVTTRSKDMADEKDNKPVELTPAQKLQARVKEFVDTAELFGDSDEQKTSYRTMARKLAADEAMTLDDLKRDVLAAMKEAETTTQAADAATVAARNGGGVVQFSYVTKPRNFKGERAAERAYRFAKWILGGPLGDEKARQWCADHGIALQRGQQESVNEKGGYTVPHEFGNDLIDLREDYGVFRRNAKIVPMASDSRSDPRRAGGLTAYFEDESDAGTESTKNWSRVNLRAKKLMCLARYSSEINEDSMVNTGDDLAGEIAYAFSNKEDLCGFLGDGSSTYGGINGVATKLTTLKLSTGAAATIAQTAGLQVATGTGSYGSIVLADFSKAKSRLPAYALRRNPKWYMHQSFFSGVVEPLIIASGGITADMVAAGVPLRLLGYPVEVTQVLPFNWAIDQIVAIFGSLEMAASMGDRRQTTIAMSEHRAFETDEIMIRGTERFDINVHDVGNAASAAADRVPGPVAALITAHT